MSHLIDTNILTRVIVVKDALSPVAQAAIDNLQQRRESLLVAPQNLMEFWAVASRPREANGLGLPVANVIQEIERFEGMFGVIEESAGAFRRWRQLVETHSVRGKQVFDAHWRIIFRFESGHARDVDLIDYH